MSDLMQAALDYARQGWRVFPCEPGGKQPYGLLATEGLKNATTSQATIRFWWSECPEANVGVATGEGSGLLVVDVDPDKDGRASLILLTERHGPLPPTARSRTGRGGEHLWFLYPRVGHYGNRAGRLGPGIDTRGEGGYVVAPPSRTSGAYAWLDHPATYHPVGAPDWLLDLLRDKPAERPALQPAPAVSSKYAETALSDELAAVAMATEGSRNDTLNSAAFSLGQLVGAHLLEEFTTEGALLNAARVAGLPESEAIATIRSGLRAGMREPRDVPPPRSNGAKPIEKPADDPAWAALAPQTVAPPARAIVETKADPLMRLSDALDAYFKALDAAKENGTAGVPTGFADLDSVTGGLKAGDLIILAARPSVGKSAFAFNLARNAAGQGVPVLVFSLEMSAHQIAERLLSAEARVDAQRLRQGYVDEHEWRRVSEAFGILSELPIWLDESPAPSILEVTERASRAVAEKGIGLIAVDYLQLVRCPGVRERHLAVGEVSRGLKALARDCKVPVLALSQLSRGVEARADHKPMLSDLRESGNLEQDADIVAFLHREEMFNPTTDRRNIADLIIAKHRNGRTASIPLRWQPGHVRFCDLEIYRTPE